ncbi:MAG TPA: 30S ribosomal protein S4 [Candidatus Omnitrophota bacterium]|nr:30S ribosomal protein S4 [Candidatus Omnitrophota bacterium]
MARYTGPRWRLSRREGVELFSAKRNALERRDYAPGQHGSKRAKLSDYGIQLREKQKVKRLYGVLERQFRRYYEKATGSTGVTGTVLLQLLERRLDNVIYRLGFATTRPQARQIVNHGLVCVNDKRVDIPSFLVKVGDEVSIKPKENIKKYVQTNIEMNKQYQGREAVPAWVNVDVQHLKGKVLRLPEREDITFPINEKLIIELYSK